MIPISSVPKRERDLFLEAVLGIAKVPPVERMIRIEAMVDALTIVKEIAEAEAKMGAVS